VPWVIAVVGSREYPRLDEVRNFVASLPPDVGVISGGAKGVDTAAEEEAKRCGLSFRLFPANWKKHGKGAGFKRNKEMYDFCDYAVVFWDGQSKGSAWWKDRPKTQHIWYGG